MADRVILLHGILRKSGSLAKLARHLAAAGFETLNLDYPSRTLPLERLAEEVHNRAADFLSPQAGNTHFVTHSMGGLVARAVIARDRPATLGRVVMLAPPNQGSEIADLLAGVALYRRIFGPAGQQLGTRARAMDEPVDYPVGILAGDRAFDPLGWLVLPKPNDGKVTVVNTRLAGMQDHMTLHATHTLMMNNREVIRQTIYFLRNGRFIRA